MNAERDRAALDAKSFGAGHDADRQRHARRLEQADLEIGERDGLLQSRQERQWAHPAVDPGDERAARDRRGCAEEGQNRQSRDQGDDARKREDVDRIEPHALDQRRAHRFDILALPRVVALVVALPILTFVGSISAIAGGALVAWIDSGVSPFTFLARLQGAVTLSDLEVGLIKAPCMALLIGVVACSEGFRVQGSAVSLGVQTTASVVKSIFLVIVLDGLFAIFFSSIGV